MAAWGGPSGYAVQNATDLFQIVNCTALLHLSTSWNKLGNKSVFSRFVQVGIFAVVSRGYFCRYSCFSPNTINTKWTTTQQTTSRDPDRVS